MVLLVTVIAVWCFSYGAAKESKLTLLSQAVKTHGAACLDGSPPGYYHRSGQSRLVSLRTDFFSCNTIADIIVSTWFEV